MKAICVFDSDFERCPAPTFSWMGAALSSQETRLTTSHVSVLTLTPRPQDHGTDLTCRVDFSRKGVSAKNTVQLNVACEFGGGLQGERQPPLGGVREMGLAVGSSRGSTDRKGHSLTMGGEVNAVWSFPHKCVFVTCLSRG